MTTPPRYWFRAKRYGWGWGLPLTWEGWVVLLGFVAGVAASATLMPEHPVAWAVVNGVLVVGLVWISFAKGEPPRWRWG